MRFFKVKEFNWKYILGELLLLFVGINLAIWFNDWNSSKTLQKNKEIALEKIEGEVKTNLEQLEEDSALNQKIPLFFEEMKRLKGDQKELITSPTEMYAFIQKFPEYFGEVDSTAVGNGLFSYDIDTSINLEITDLSSIAWDIAKSTGIFHEFGYDCLYDLQAMYNTQDLVKNEIDKATEALRNRSMQDLLRTLGIMKQLEEQLADQYRGMLQNIDNCK